MKWGFKPREFFQKFGTEYGQYILPEHFPSAFTDINKKTILGEMFLELVYQREKKDPTIKVVISDVRFLHEFTFLQERGAYLIKINRLTDNLDRHISENELDILTPDDYNGVLDNNGSKSDLYVKIRDMIN